MLDVALELQQNLEEPARARAFVADQLADYSHDTRADALLLVSELVSNVVQHGVLPARMRLKVDGGRLHVVVEDSGADLPKGPDSPEAAEVLAGNGRGLIIVASIAAAWGITTLIDQAGKSVWFDLAAVH